MKTIRYLAFAGGLSSLVMLVTAACSSDPDRASFDVEPDAAVGHLPDAMSTPDAESDVGAADARGPFDPNAEAVVCADSGPCAVDVVAGQYHFCALMSDKTVRCWGDDTYGNLGGGTPPVDAGKDAGKDAGDAGGAGTDAGFVVGQAPTLTGVTQISAAATTSCALLSTGDVKCWGADDSGQLGLTVDPYTQDYDPHALPARVALASAASRIDVGQRGACAVLATGAVWCWGDNEEGQLGLSADTFIGGPAKSTILTGKVTLTASSTNTAFSLDDKGHLSSWGAVADIQGSAAGRISSTSPDLVPAVLGIPTPITSFSVSSWFDYAPSSTGDIPDRGLAHACAVSKGALYCWGDSALGAMGVGLPALVALPTAVVVKSAAYPQQVSAAHEHTCTRLTDGAIHCVGDDSFGQLGRTEDGGAYEEFFAPADAFTGHAVKVIVSDTTTCALVQGGDVMCWGGNQYGELGQGTTDTTAHRKPIAVRF